MSGRRDVRRISRLAGRQAGNVTYAQLAEAAVEPDEVDRLVAAGWLIRRHRAVFAVGHVPRSRVSRWWAGSLALGPLAVLSHRAAGAFWEIHRGAVPTEVTVPTTAGLRHRDGIVVHRAALADHHVQVVDGLRVTTVLRTVLDLAAVLPIRQLARAFEQAQVHHHLSPDAVAVELIVRRGYRGTGRLRRLLVGAVDPAAVRSVLELRFLELCLRFGIERPLVNERIGAWTPDFLWPDAKLVVETDGYDFHSSVAARRRDASKEEELGALGFSVLRLTWRDVDERPAEVARTLRDASSVA